MKIALLLPDVDASVVICEDAVALVQIFRAKGYAAGIFSDNPHLHEIAQPLKRMPRLSGEDMLLYYPCIGTDSRMCIDRLACRKVMLFSQTVPPRYWKGYQETRREEAERSMQELCRLASRTYYCMTVSAYQASVLRELNYQCPIAVRPPLMSFSEYSKAPDPEIMTRYDGDGYVNFLFVGALSPQKKQEDVIRAFYAYQKYCNPKSRLFLVGSDAKSACYNRRLRRYTDALELSPEQVVFTGEVSFAALLAYYHLASLFLCMSEYEGFCVPLVEAMYFGVPILAYDASSTADVLGDSGVLLPTNDPMEAALMADRILCDPALRREITAGQRHRQQAFAYPAVRKQLEEQFQDFLDQVSPRTKKRGKRKMPAEV
ncbi:MAG: glycosyltransferase family 4 protein [Ruminococcus sp.]|nr:glycosyltransferase family 4 protein [Ruminococcus sp.]